MFDPQIKTRCKKGELMGSMSSHTPELSDLVRSSDIQNIVKFWKSSLTMVNGSPVQ